MSKTDYAEMEKKYGKPAKPKAFVDRLLVLHAGRLVADGPPRDVLGEALELEAERTLLARLEALAQAWPINEVPGQQEWLEGLATEAANLDHDALLQLRAMATNT